MNLPAPVVLASASPTRRHLLAKVVAQFEVVPPRVDEHAVRHEDPAGLVRERARAKARQVARKRAKAVVIGADTVAVCQGEIIGKPRDRADAVRILSRLAGHAHTVLTGLCVIGPCGRELVACVSTEICMRRLSPGRLQELADKPGAMDAAGAYRIEPDDPNLEWVRGSTTNVMGLPLDQLRAMLTALRQADEGRQ